MKLVTFKTAKEAHDAIKEMGGDSRFSVVDRAGRPGYNIRFFDGVAMWLQDDGNFHVGGER